MSSTRKHRHVGGRLTRQFAALALALAASCVCAAGAMAAGNVNIVRQAGAPSGEIPKGTHYYTTIQAAVEASFKNDWVLIEPGTYHEAVKVTAAHAGISIRGMDRNGVIIDGDNHPGVGVEISKTNKVSVENLTVRNFDTGECDCGNEIWFNGGDGSGTIGAHGWIGRYLTAYDTGVHGGYGIFTSNEEDGEYENIYASGFNDSGLYIGACRECGARVTGAVMENNALGYSGSNSSGRLVIENSIFRHNLTGIAPNSENPSDPPPPLDGACNSFKNTSPTPKFDTTKIQRCEVLRNNRVEDNSNLTAPTNGSTEVAPWGVGIELPGDYAVLVEGNFVAGNPNNGVLGFEYPNPFPPEPQTIFFQFSGNRISNNAFSGNGYNQPGGASSIYTGDLSMLSGYAELFGGPPSESVNNCASGNQFTAQTFPAEIEGTWGCQNKTTPNPGDGLGAAEYLLTLQAEAEFIRTPLPQPAPGAQPTMPKPCAGVPKNPLCPKGNIK